MAILSALCASLTAGTLRPLPVRASSIVTFAPPVSYAAGIRPYGVVVGDFNADGYSDLEVTGFDGTNASVNVLLNHGDGTFAAPVSYPDASGGGIWR
jgi:hypothetical protein